MRWGMGRSEEWHRYLGCLMCGVPEWLIGPTKTLLWDGKICQHPVFVEILEGPWTTLGSLKTLPKSKNPEG